jgi:hypothetical protein
MKATRFEEISISRLTSFTLLGHEEPQLVDGMRTSSNLFHLLGAHAMLGRLLLPDDEVGGKYVAVISHRLWQRFFSSDPQFREQGHQHSGQPVHHRWSPQPRLHAEFRSEAGRKWKA